MLHVLLLILKILLYIILCILGLLLLIILLVLFAPIRYRIEAEYHGKAKVYAKVRFLILSVAVHFDQEDKSFDNIIRVAGFCIMNNEDDQPKKAKKSKKSKKIKKSNKKHHEELTSETDEVIKAVPKFEENDIYANINNVVESEQRDDNALLNEEYDLWDNEDNKHTLPEKEKSVFGRIKAFFKGLAEKVKKIFSKLKELKEKPAKIAEEIKGKVEKAKRKIDRLQKFWNASCTVRTRKYLKKYLIGLAKHIGPRKVKGHVRYGFDEPYKTGKTTGYLSLMPFVYRKDFYLEPDFYNKVLEGNVLLKGRIRIGYIIRIALNINLWRTIKLARKI